jgi:antitoxin ChpS
MHTTKIRKVGSLVMLAVPPALLKQLHLQAGATVKLAIHDGCLVVKPKPCPHYTLKQLLAASNYSLPQPCTEREWVDAPAFGGELF